MKKIWSLFSSIKTAIILFFLIAGTSIIGTVIKQQPTPEGYERIYGQFWAKVIKALELYDMYHSWWFQLLLLLFTINLVVCSIDRLPRVLKFFKRESRIREREYLSQLQLRCTGRFKGSPEALKERVLALLREAGFKAKEEMKQNETLYIFAEKGLLNRLGVYITHFSILFILLGGLIGSMFGFTGYMTLVEGGKSNNVVLRGGFSNKALPFFIECEDFRIVFYKNNPNVPKAYISSVKVLDGGRVVKEAEVKVNHPLKYKGIYFYQSSYGVFSSGEGVLTVKIRDEQTGKVEKVDLKVGQEKDVKDMGVKLKLVAFYPDFVLTPEGPASRSDELNNPAALIELSSGNETSRVWVFAFFPNIHQKKSRYKLSFVKFEPVFYTVLQVSKDPGVWLVWVGCILLVGAILMTFFWSHRRVFVWITPKGKETEVAMGFATNRNLEGFKKWVERFCSDAKNKLKEVK